MKFGLISIFVLATAIGGCGDDGDSNSGADAAAGAATCATYCSNALANCTGANEIYADSASCLSACAAMPLGTSADTAGNTVGCRSYHAGAPAIADATAHCQHAGIASSGGVCGTAADAYCDQVLANCSALYADRAACDTAAGAMTAGMWNDTAGDTIECRAYHASFPAVADGAMHCPHASSTPTAPCM